MSGVDTGPAGKASGLGSVRKQDADASARTSMLFSNAEPSSGPLGTGGHWAASERSALAVLQEKKKAMEKRGWEIGSDANLAKAELTRSIFKGRVGGAFAAAGRSKDKDGDKHDLFQIQRELRDERWVDTLDSLADDRGSTQRFLQTSVEDIR